jgi:hypothetical protein
MYHDFAALLYYSSFDDDKLKVIDRIARGQVKSLRNFDDIIRSESYGIHPEKSVTWIDTRTFESFTREDWLIWLGLPSLKRPPLPNINVELMPSLWIRMIFGHDAFGVRISDLPWLIHSEAVLNTAVETVRDLCNQFGATQGIISSHQIPSWKMFTRAATFSQSLAANVPLHKEVTTVNDTLQYPQSLNGAPQMGYWKPDWANSSNPKPRAVESTGN